MGPGERAVLQAAVARGWVSHQQVEEAQKIAEQLGTAGGVLAILSERYFTPIQREEMRAVWREASGQDATRADAVEPRADEATLAPPVAHDPDFDPRGDTLAPQRTDLGTLSPAPAVFVAEPETPPAVSPSGRYDPHAATILEPAGPAIAPPLPAQDDFRSAQTLLEGPPGADLRSMRTMIDEREKTVEQASRGPEQTEVARRDRAGQTRPDDPRSQAGLSGVDPSLLSRGGGAGPKAPRKLGPERIGKFKVVRELGRGGMGVVYEARDEYLDRPVALKVLLGGLSASDQAVQRFRIEGLAAERLKHENVVQVLELGQDPQEGNWYMAMELIRGVSLKEKLEKGGPLDEATAIRYTMQLARALGFAHQQNVLHRDVKPHNVLLDGQDVPKLTDFGLAKLVGDHQHSLTATGPSVMGTPGFMPPEQAGASNEAPDQRADVYSLGATLFYMLTGRAPFQDDSVARVLMAVVKSPPPLPSTLRPGLSHDLETIVLKCLEKKPDDRYPDMAALEEDLQRFIDARQIVARRPGPLVRLSRWVAANQVSAIGLSLAALLCSGLLAREILREPPAPPIVPGNGNGKGLAIPTSGAVSQPPSSAAIVATWAWVGPPWDGAEPWRDKVYPTLTPRAPEPETVVGDRNVPVRVEAQDDSGTVEVTLDDQPLDLSKSPDDPPGTFVGFWRLEARDGEHTATVAAVDTSGNRTEAQLRVRLDLVNPTVKVLQPTEEEVTTARTAVQVAASEPVRLEADWGVSKVRWDEYREEHRFEVPLDVDQEVELRVTVRDRAGRKGEVIRRLKRIEHPWLRGDGRWLPSPPQREAASAGRPAMVVVPELELRLVLLPKGSYRRNGGTATITKERYIGATEVTNIQFAAFDPSHTSGAEGLDGAHQPAVKVTWARAMAFCEWLGQRRPELEVNGKRLRLSYRLPTEAEWELAARGLTDEQWWLLPLGSGKREDYIHELPRPGAGKPDARATLPVGKKRPNPLGLYDILGNVDEWCLDGFAESLPTGDDPWQKEYGPRAVDKGKRPIRGGSYLDGLEACSPSRRNAWDEAKGDRGIGFRVLAEIVGE